MMRFELREEDPNVNIVLWSGITIGDNKGKQLEDSTWVHKASMKEPEHTKESFMEASKSFIDASTSRSKDRLEPEMDPSMLIMFLETCMKLLHEGKAVKGLQELVNKWAGTTLEEPCVVQKIGKHATRTRREMRLTTKIGEYEMDQVILDLGSDANVMLKKTWEHIGRPMLQWSTIQL